MSMLKRVPKLLLCTALGMTLCFQAACDKDKDKDEDNGDKVTDGSTQISTGRGSNKSTNAQRNGFFPRIEPINTSVLGKSSSASLVDEDDDKKCAHLEGESLGAAGFALGGACHTADFGAELMLGKANETTKIAGDTDADGKTDCNDLDEEKSGILMHLLCNPILGQFSEITSLAFGNDDPGKEGEAIAITFADIANDNLTAAGNWTQGSEKSFPANIGISIGNGYDKLNNVVAMALKDLNNGTLYLKMDKADTEDKTGFSGKTDFSTKSATDLCASAPSAENCHWQDISLYFGKDLKEGPPNGFHLKMFADDKVNPTFLALEGKYNYVGSRTEFKDVIEGTEEIYFQFVQTSGEMWMKMFFKDKDGKKISNIWLTAYENGTCQKFGSSNPVACDSIVASDYDKLWIGDANFSSVKASPFDTLEFPEAPANAGVCTSEGCLNF